jgi:hypothetical protein
VSLSLDIKHFEAHVLYALGGILDKMNYAVNPRKATSPVPRGQVPPESHRKAN